MSLEIYYVNSFAPFKASIFPSLILFNKDMKGNGNSSNSNLYDCNDVQQSSNACCIISLE